MPDYAADDAYLGAVVGRYANRIAHGRFVLDGVTYELPTNDRGHTLHGGMDGFHRRVWAGVGFADGERAGVRGTPFDFTPPAATEGPAAAVSLGDRVRSDHPQVAAVNGLDHCLVLRGGVGLRRAALLHAPESGRVLETWTTEPGLQIYTANALGAPFGRHAAVCLETQRIPDSPNRPAYPSTVLRPGQAHCSSTQYRFTHLPTR
ncbi:aldose epimerase family protein [Streptodolium elevatio]